MEILDIIKYVGGWAALTVILASFIGRFFSQIISENLKIKWSKEQEEKLEQIRAEIDREHLIFTKVLDSYSSSHQFSQSNRIKAVEILWDNVLNLRNLCSFPLLFFDALYEMEYNQVYSNNIMMSGLNSLSIDDANEEMSTIIDNVEKYRPFLGEQLWSIFRIYIILSIRPLYLLVKGRDTKNIKSWDEDEYIQTILNKTLTEEDKKSIPSYPKNMHPLRPTVELMEQKILFETLKIISGELAAENDFSKAKSLQNLLKQLEINKNLVSTSNLMVNWKNEMIPNPRLKHQ